MRNTPLFLKRVEGKQNVYTERSYRKLPRAKTGKNMKVVNKVVNVDIAEGMDVHVNSSSVRRRGGEWGVAPFCHPRSESRTAEWWTNGVNTTKKKAENRPSTRRGTSGCVRYTMRYQGSIIHIAC